jgi:hypothetical protein
MLTSIFYFGRLLDWYSKILLLIVLIALQRRDFFSLSGSMARSIWNNPKVKDSLLSLKEAFRTSRILEG